MVKISHNQITVDMISQQLHAFSLDERSLMGRKPEGLLIVCLALKKYWLYFCHKCRAIRQTNEKKNKTQARSLKDYRLSYIQYKLWTKIWVCFVLLQVLKEIREVRAMKGKTENLGWSMSAGEGPHVLVELKLFTKVSIGQSVDLQGFLY